MDSNLDSFKGTETNIGNQFGGSGSSKVQGGLVLGSGFFTSKFTVQVFEVFVETILAGTLN